MSESKFTPGPLVTNYLRVSPAGGNSCCSDEVCHVYGDELKAQAWRAAREAIKKVRGEK